MKKLLILFLLILPACVVFAEEINSVDVVKKNDGHEYVCINNEFCHYAETIPEAADYVRQELYTHKDIIKVAYGSDEDEKDLTKEMDNEVFSGNYFDFMMTEYNLCCIRTDKSVNDKKLIYFQIQPSYYITDKEEKEADAEVKRIVAGLSGRSDFEKIKEIYDYICRNVTYDWDYARKSFSSYGALVNKKATCQGYAMLLLQMGTDAGLDVKVIGGKTGDGIDHSWNAVKLGDVYYYLDPTWDSEQTGYDFFLKGSEDFKEDHILNAAPTFAVSSSNYITLVDSITLTGPSDEMEEGAGMKLAAEVLPGNAFNKNIKWSSSDAAAASVSQDGYVTAKANAAGKTVTITAEALDESGEEDSWDITITKKDTEKIVLPTKAKKITLKGISHKIAAGRKIKLTVSFTPAGVANKKIKWTSSNKKLATVGQNGTVSIKKKTGGKTVRITAATTDGSNLKAVWKIKICKGIVKKVTLKNVKSIKVGKKVKLKATVKATPGANKTLKWTSSNKKYATVNAKGVVKALKKGKGKTVKITARATDGSNKSKSIRIKIK